MAPRKDTAAVATYGDHEVITPENKLRKAVSTSPRVPGEDDPVARAEKALAELSTEFGAWMEFECERLDQARRDRRPRRLQQGQQGSLFHAAHDIKGEAATFGFPAVAAAADSLCRLIEHTPDRHPHSDASWSTSMSTRCARSIANMPAPTPKELAAVLTTRLREVTDEFLIRENRDRPDVLEQIRGPAARARAAMIRRLRARAANAGRAAIAGAQLNR